MKTLTVGIRRAEEDDAAAIASIHQAAWQGAYAGIIPHRALTAMINRRGQSWWASAIKRAASVLVVEVGGKVVGYVEATANKDANALARKVADDEARDFACRYSEAMWHGERRATAIEASSYFEDKAGVE